MHRKMRVPLTRSKTVDENLMRWSSPETSEHSGVIDNSLRFKKKGSIIPQIHVQECIQHHPEDTSSLDRKFLKSRLKYYGEPKKLILENRARSFEYNNAENFYADGSERIGDFDLPRRAKSVDYEAVSNIFSDDSLRTARRKVKKNLSESGDHLPTLKALSKSYYDSNGSSSIQTSETADPDEDPERKYYSQESALYPSIIDHKSFDRVPSMGIDTINYSNDFHYKNILKHEDNNKRKYEAHLAEISRKSNRSQSPTSKAKTLEEHLYDLLENDHIYCSIDENNTDPCPCLIDPLDCNFDVVDTSSSRKSNFDDSVSVGRITNETDEYNPRKSLRRRTKSTDSYLEDNYEDYNKPYSSDYLHLDVDKNQQQLLPSQQEFHEEYRARSSSFPGKFDYYDNQEYTSYPTRRRRRTTKILKADYDLQPYRTSRMNSLEVPTFSQSKRMMLERAESTPTLGPEEEEIEEDSWEVARRLSRRRRNSSCPEARDMRNIEGSTAGREHQTESPTFFMGSDDDFGSVETVVCSDYRLSKNNIADDEQSHPRLSLPRYFSKDYADTKIQMRTDRSSSYPGPVKYETDDIDYKNRKTSCPECRLSDHHRDPINPTDGFYETHRPLAYQQQEHNRLRRLEQQDRDQGNKRNVAISDTLEYYEYSMESESQCSENCGFGPYDNTTTTLRPRNRAPRPGNANSNIFDSQTATSDTANYPRANVHHDTTTIPSSHHVKRDNDVHRSVPPRQRNNSTDATVNQSAKNDNDNNTGTINDNKRSDYSSQSSSYEKTTSRHTAVGDGHNGHSKRGQFTRSLSNADAPQDEKADGSLSDTAVGLHVEEAARRTRKSSPGSKSGSSSGGGSAVQYQAGLGKKSNSTSQLSATECGVTGSGTDPRPSSGSTSRKRNSTPNSSFQRSQEVVPSYQQFGPRQGGSVASETAGSLNSISSSEASSWPGARMLTDSEHHLSEFIDGLGPGQLVGRQALGAPSFGDIQLSIKYNKGYLEVEVIRAKDLQLKPKAGILPSPYVKMYLVKGRKCLEKQKTTTARATREPFYQQSLAFKEDIKGCFLQVSVWGDHCSLGTKKDFVGVAQILLDDLNLSDMVFGWYKLFNSTSL